MERPWLILGRVLHFDMLGFIDMHVAAEAQEEEEHAAAVDSVAEAQQAAAVGGAEEGVQHAGIGEAAEQLVAAVDATAEAQHAAVGEAVEDAQAAQEEQPAGIGEAEEQAAVGDQEQEAATEADLLQAQLEESVVNAANTNAAAPEAAHAARGAAAAPDFTISVAPPPRVSSVTAGPSSHPDPAAPDLYPYIIAAGRFCLLAHFSVAPAHGTHFDGQPIRSYLVVVRHFRRRAAAAEDDDDDGGRIAACAVRVPDRPDNFSAVANIESVGLVCNEETGHYQIAELDVAPGYPAPPALLFYMSSDTSVWQTNYLVSPLEATGHPHREWVPHGTVTINSTVLWYDLSWGIISCDLAQPRLLQQLIFHRLPHGCVLGGGGANMRELELHTRRCIAVSESLVRYVEITLHPYRAPTVSMWHRDVENNPDRWINNYREISFTGIWDDDTYVQTKLPRNPPVLVGVSPVDSNVVYFTLNHRLFGVNVPEHRVVGCQEYEPLHRPGPPDEPVSGRFLITWNLDADGAAINTGHQQDDSDHGDSGEGGPMDDGEIDYQYQPQLDLLCYETFEGIL